MMLTTTTTTTSRLPISVLGGFLFLFSCFFLGPRPLAACVAGKDTLGKGGEAICRLGLGFVSTAAECLPPSYNLFFRATTLETLSQSADFFCLFFARDFSSTCSLSCRSTTCFFSELAGERGGKHRWLSEAGQIGQEPKKTPSKRPLVENISSLRARTLNNVDLGGLTNEVVHFQDKKKGQERWR